MAARHCLGLGPGEPLDQPGRGLAGVAGLIDRRSGDRERQPQARQEQPAMGRRRGQHQRPPHAEGRYGVRNASTGTSVVPAMCSGQGMCRFQGIRLYSRHWQGRVGRGTLDRAYPRAASRA